MGSSAWTTFEFDGELWALAGGQFGYASKKSAIEQLSDITLGRVVNGKLQVFKSRMCLQNKPQGEEDNWVLRVKKGKGLFSPLDDATKGIKEIEGLEDAILTVALDHATKQIEK